MKYASPEVVLALEAGEKTVVVDPASDIWAVGVIAFELLTGEPIFPRTSLDHGDRDKETRDAISGRTQLPWERPDAKALLEKLRGLRRSIMRCLDRDSAQRPTAEALLKSWDNSFDYMHTQGTAQSQQMP